MNLKKFFFASNGIIALVLILSISGCGVYSFTGASIPPEVKSISIAYFPNQAKIVVPTLSQIFTEKFKDKFVNESGLILDESGGDIEFDGAISGYTFRPAASGAGDIADLNRLTITVKVNYINSVTDEQWSQSFNSFRDYERSLNVSDVEDGFIEEITQDIVDDIFNKVFANW